MFPPSRRRWPRPHSPEGWNPPIWTSLPQGQNGGEQNLHPCIIPPNGAHAPSVSRSQQFDNECMKLNEYASRALWTVLCGLVGCAFTYPQPGQAAVTNVTIQDFFFNPADVTIKVDAQILWTWADTSLHSSTSGADLTPDGLWDSGLTAQQGFSFPLTFTTAGSFPYSCSFHLFTGSVKAQAANVPPSAAITSPTNGAVFAAPWAGTIHATVSATGAIVSKVDFFSGATPQPLGTVTNPPASVSFTVTNLATGSYTLKAVATDSWGATNTSAGVGISVVTPRVIVLSSPSRLSAPAFQFSYSANPGLSYVMLRTGVLTNLVPISTNMATSSAVNFIDNSATGAVNIYDVHLVPNP